MFSRMFQVAAVALCLWGVPACGEDTEIALLSGGAGGSAGNAGADGGGSGGTTACGSSTQCTGEQPFCDTTRGRCVGCLVAGHCELGRACDPRGRCTDSCSTPADCTSGDSPFCDPSSGACVECLTAGDCNSGGESRCVLNRCVECASDQDCVGDKPYCALGGNECRECLVDGHCATGQVCDPEELQCKPG